MELNTYILNDIKPFKNTGNIKDIKLLCSELTYSHIPVQSEEGVFLGSFSETDIHCFDSNKTINDYTYAIEGFFVRENTIWLDVLEAFASNSTNVMPILDEHNNYLGYYELKDIIGLFNETPFFYENGNVLVIEKGINDYSFSEISQIVESNNGKLLGALVSKMNSDIIQITLKIGNIGLNDVIQTFRRYSYHIISGHEEDSYIEDLKERSEYLNKYLNM
jgi:predicted transcriptional regulator